MINTESIQSNIIKFSIILIFRCDMINSSDVHFAIGDYWSDGTVDIKSALCISDERMYSDKKAFYERYPELRRN